MYIPKNRILILAVFTSYILGIFMINVGNVKKTYIYKVVHG